MGKLFSGFYTNENWRQRGVFQQKSVQWDFPQCRKHWGNIIGEHYSFYYFIIVFNCMSMSHLYRYDKVSMVWVQITMIKYFWFVVRRLRILEVWFPNLPARWEWHTGWTLAWQAFLSCPIPPLHSQIDQEGHPLRKSH